MLKGPPVFSKRKAESGLHLWGVFLPNEDRSLDLRLAA